jgi:Cu/Ag efflux protein CusF
VPILLGATLVMGCGKKEQTPSPPDSAKIAAGPVKTGQGKGIVRAVDTGARTITLDHSNVPNVMDAMTMEYFCEPADALQKLKVGDSVAFTLQDRGEGNFVVSAISAMKK